MEILGEEVTGKQLVKLSVDTLATHQLLQYAKTNNKEERIRMVSGLTLLGIGYLYGPHLQERLAALKDPRIDEATQERILYAAGGAILGSIAGKYFGNGKPAAERPALLVGPPAPRHPRAPPLPGAPSATLQEVVATATDNPTFHRPSGLIMVGSIGWLGYSLFFNGKSPEEKTRHLWGLGAGAVGYAFGPDILHKFERIALTRKDADDARGIYGNGGMLLGAALGGVLGWRGADDIKRTLRVYG